MNTVDKYDVRFDFVRFIKFLRDNNIASTAIAAVLSDRVNEITNEFFEGFVIPIINRDGDKDGVRDIKKFEEREVEIFGAKFKLGRFILALVKFLVITYLIYIISRIMGIKN